jgi:hypothetical protein
MCEAQQGDIRWSTRARKTCRRASGKLSRPARATHRSMRFGLQLRHCCCSPSLRMATAQSAPGTILGDVRAGDRILWLTSEAAGIARRCRWEATASLAGRVSCAPLRGRSCGRRTRWKQSRCYRSFITEQTESQRKQALSLQRAVVHSVWMRQAVYPMRHRPIRANATIRQPSHGRS